MQNLVAIGFMVRYREISEAFPIDITPCKSCEPQGGAKFDPGAISWALLVEAH